MNDIKKIVIKGSSGYGLLSESYEDKLTLTAKSITYQRNAKASSQKWSYKTNSIAFKQKFEQVAKMLLPICNDDIALNDFACDVGYTIFALTMANGNKIEKTYWGVMEFKNHFALIKQMIPPCEYMPDVLIKYL